MIRFSVVIPVYKVEDYLDQCVESVVNQTYRHLEAILVDDGSPDRCGEMCDRWAEKDDRILVMHQENGGLSAARNTGIRHATGDYILFLDSDDWWENQDVLAAIAEQLEKTPVDVLSFNYRKDYEGVLDKPYFDANIPSSDQAEDLSYMIKNDLLVCSSWNKAVRLTLLKDQRLFFRVGITSEDIDWTLRLATMANSFSYINQCVLVYRQRSMSITHSVNEKSVKMLRDNIFRCMELLKNVAHEKKEQLNYYLAYQYATLVYNVAGLPKRDRKPFWEDIKNMRYLLGYSINPKVKMIGRCERYFGLRFTMWLLHLKRKRW